MNIGMLWKMENPDLDVEAQIRAAARYYRNKFGYIPHLCLINPADASKDLVKYGVKNDDNIIEVQSLDDVRIGYFLIGLNDMENGIENK
jgi:hypothetical protein